MLAAAEAKNEDYEMRMARLMAADSTIEILNEEITRLNKVSTMCSDEQVEGETIPVSKCLVDSTLWLLTTSTSENNNMTGLMAGLRYRNWNCIRST